MIRRSSAPTRISFVFLGGGGSSDFCSGGFSGGLEEGSGMVVGSGCGGSGGDIGMAGSVGWGGTGSAGVGTGVRPSGNDDGGVAPSTVGITVGVDVSAMFFSEKTVLFNQRR